MERIIAFCMGMYEFRRALTMRFENDAACMAYDYGREFAHRVTFRHFED